MSASNGEIKVEAENYRPKVRTHYGACDNVTLNFTHSLESVTTLPQVASYNHV